MKTVKMVVLMLAIVAPAWPLMAASVSGEAPWCTPRLRSPGARAWTKPGQPGG